jgi:hypothetical protein
MFRSSEPLGTPLALNVQGIQVVGDSQLGANKQPVLTRLENYGTEEAQRVLFKPLCFRRGGCIVLSRLGSAATLS